MDALEASLSLQRPSLFDDEKVARDVCDGEEALEEVDKRQIGGENDEADGNEDEGIEEIDEAGDEIDEAGDEIDEARVEIDAEEACVESNGEEVEVVGAAITLPLFFFPFDDGSAVLSSEARVDDFLLLGIDDE